MDSTTFTAYRLDQHRAAQLHRDTEIIRSQRARASAAAPDTRTGVIARIVRAAVNRRGRRVAPAH